MLDTICGVVHEGKIELSESARLPEGARVLVTVLRPGDQEFWLDASQPSLNEVWDNPEDDVYGHLLKK